MSLKSFVNAVFAFTAKVAIKVETAFLATSILGIENYQFIGKELSYHQGQTIFIDREFPDLTNLTQEELAGSLASYLDDLAATGLPLFALFTSKDLLLATSQLMTVGHLAQYKNGEAATVQEVGPEFTGGVNGGESAIHEAPEYTGVIGTAGDEVAVKEVPEFTGSVNAAEAAIHEAQEYTGAMGTAGDQAAPTVDKPTEEVRVLSDKSTGVVVAGLARDLAPDMHLQVQKVKDQSLQGMEFDAYALHLVDKDNHKVQLKGAVLVRLPVSGEVAGVYYTASGEAVSFTNGQGTVEFTTSQLGHFAVVYKQVSKPQTPSVGEPGHKPQTPLTEEPGSQVQTPSTEKLDHKPQDAAVQKLDQKSDDTAKPEMKEVAAKQEAKDKLPETGTSKSDHLFFLASLSLAMSALFLAKRKED